MPNSYSVSTQAESFIFRKKGGTPHVLILKRHKNKLFIAILETKYPIDSFIGELTAAIFNIVVKKYDEHKR